MKKRKYDLSVKKAILQIFPELEHKFWNWKLCNEVKRIRSSYYLSDGTILRDLRYLREEGKLNYRSCKDGLYTKLCNCSGEAIENKCQVCKLEKC